ncbi:exo-beta-N-acetylmuramidase NamZ domain-containing protein [Pedobacter sp. WC2423]|uniref:exo-beta-N-acetylmuramidase NamZ family protein n=1 Tax=Pedobacter sp. WC2423 TaxID=3234142 RepID=UPI003467859E
MKLSSSILLPVCLAIFSIQACANSKLTDNDSSALKPAESKNTGHEILTGAAQTEKYLPLLQGKRVGMVVNPTSVINETTSVDSLLKRGVNIVKIFGPEHGFRGDASAGIKVDDAIDKKTGIKAVSLYGKHEIPTPADLADVDIMVFDIQDVGVRFYTYINTLQYVMQACAENKKELIILDRPNPNGFYIDGPILDSRLVSGIGLKPIPIVHGLTVGEYAQMLNGEGWLKNKLKCKITIIKVAGYTHDMPYDLPVKPSPNLNTQQSILLYPTLCLFEGTYLSQGRGTQFPFTVLGAPALKGKYTFSFTPKSIKGMAETPLHQNQECYGLDLRNYNISNLRKNKVLNLKWLIELYQAYPDKADFFNFKLSKQMNNFDKLAGVYSLKEQIIAGKSEKEIRASWEPGLSQYKKMRKKYLLYP